MSESQNDRILSFLRDGRSLTSYDALQHFGCFRLGARIHDLKNRGHNIKSETVESENGKRFARYSLARA